MASQIKPEELLDLRGYEALRPRRLAEIIALKERRRVALGPWVSCVFENRRTVLHQIQEMLRIERLSEPARIAHEIETYSELLPQDGELSVTLFIEIADAAERRRALSKLGGLEKTLALELWGGRGMGVERVAAFDKRPIDPEIERPGQATAVYYLGLRLNAEQRRLFISDAPEARLRLSHPVYDHAALLVPALRRELSSDWG
ncbi:MAG: DUF3501 family protein [Elusimicrobia bacterium]|nr:DUF3501 family protein [Elusimicrobiota bacterium]MDE2237044.1 DUF3501 family protein [Elusimicrobiota bacterium]MDE2425896.1 DUF3501 family protein [Elusimicrobiota bacterium]